MAKNKVWYEGEAAAGGGEATAAAAAAAAKGNEGTPVAFDDNFDFSGVIPADLKEDKTLAKFGTHKGKAWVENVARSLVSAQGMIGADPNELVRVPVQADKITPVERAKFMERLGMPKDEKAWSLKQVEKPVPGMEPDSDLGKWFSKTAKDAGLFPDQAQALYAQYVDQMRDVSAKQNAGFAAMDKANIEGLQKEYGQQFDNMIKASRLGAMKLGGQPFVDLVGSVGLGTDPTFIKAMAKYGEAMAESTDAGDKGGAGGYTPGQAHAEGTRLLREAMEVMDTNPGKARELNLKAQEFFAKGS